MDNFNPEFNLLVEPWIRVQRKDLTTAEVSLTDALVNAHQYKDLAGESPTQAMATYRLLLAVLHTVFSRVDADGAKDTIEEPQDVLSRWRQIWTSNKFPEIPIYNYLSSQRERFWLFHPTNPFWQAPSANIGTYYSSAKLNGEMLESENKSRLFLPRLSHEKDTLSYAEAARWLLHINGYDDTSAKPKGKGLPSPGAGYLGKIGAIIAKGGNLFETLTLNLVFLRDAAELWDEDQPVWERTLPKADERTEIAVPNNPAELLTLQSRRLLLKREDGRVCGYYLLGGDFFDRQDAFAEQWTLWRPVSKKGKADPADHYAPKQHDSSKQMWRDFSSIFLGSENKCRPGVVLWLMKLKAKNILPDSFIFQFYIAGARYGDKDFFITDVFSDSLSVSAGLLSELGIFWNENIVNEISVCDSLAWELSRLSDNLAIASGDTPSNPSDKKSVVAGKHAKEIFYSRIDVPFRQWLRSLEPEIDGADMEEDMKRWRRTVINIALNLGKELVDGAGPNAFVGREIVKQDKDKTSSVIYSSTKAYNWFCYNLKKYRGGIYEQRNEHAAEKHS